MKTLRELDTRVILVGGVGLVVAVVAVVLAINSLGGSDETPSGADALSEAELLEEMSGLGKAYWVGPRSGTEGYELTSSSDGSITIHYLAKGAGGDDSRSDLLTVATYPVPGAQNALLNAKESGQGLTLSAHGSYEVLNGAPENVYVVYYGDPDLQIEIYSPIPGEASKLANSGALTPLPLG